MRSGVIVAGGRSTRFGDADKAVALLAGTPMIRRVADRLTPVVDELVVNCRADQQDAIAAALDDHSLPTTFAPDTEPDQGPLEGIRTGLDATGGEYAFIVACDMPFLDPNLVAYLFDRAEGHDAAVPRLDDGWFQPTHAVYQPDEMVAAADAALARDDRRVIAPLDDLDHVVIREDDLQEAGSLRSFENLNTREEFEAAESAFEQGTVRDFT